MDQVTMEWRPVPGFDNVEASDNGHIRYNNGIIVQPHIRCRSYLGVSLGRGLKRGRPALVHRLVALAFHGDPQSGEEMYASQW